MATNLSLPDIPTTPLSIDGVMPIEWQEFFRLLHMRTGGDIVEYDLDELQELLGLYFDQLTTNRIVATDGDGYLVSVDPLTSWISGTTNQIIVTDDLDGTVTLSTPQDIDTDADVTFDTMTVDEIIFTETALEASERELTWNADDGTLNIGLYNDVVCQVGQEQHYYAKNVSGSQIDNGQPCMFAGTIGASGKLEIDLAESDINIPSDYFMGIATHDITNNGFGYVTSFGLVRGIDTTGTPVGEIWNDGDLLYLSTTAGELTITPPTAPDPKVLVAAVVNSHATIGSIFVRPTFGGYLSSLHDVYITSLADNELIAYDSANSRWINTSDIVVDTATINDNIILSGTVGEGIKVDPATPTYPWQDLIGEIVIRGVAATDPTFATYIGNIRQYQFNLNDLVTNNFHILHDHVPGYDYYIHAHWSHNSGSVASGSVTWSFEITYAKGHDQAAFPATKTITVTQNASSTQYQHMIAEVAFTAETADATHFDRDDIEVDGVVLVATSLSANTISTATDPFLHYIDIHYQSIGPGTKNRAPNFYVT